MHLKFVTNRVVVVQSPIRLIKILLEWRKVWYGKRLSERMKAKHFARP